jgi:hypothetical protein
MSGPAVERVLTALADHGSRVEQRGSDTWMAQCPADDHDDRTASLSVAQGDVGAVVCCQAGCDTRTAVLPPLNLGFPDLFDRRREERDRAPRRVAAEYRYTDERGELLYVKVRYEPKSFAVKRPDGRGGWTWKIAGARRVLYRLPEVLAAVKAGQPVFLVEGEKDADRLAAMGHAATCNFDGAAKDGQRAKWRPEYGDVLKGADVVIIADRDEGGYAHARAAYADLGGKAKSVAIMQAAVDRAHADVSDHLATGLGLGDLLPVHPDAPAGGGEGERSQASPEDMLAPIRQVVMDADEDLLPGRVVGIVKDMAGRGMDDEIRLTVRAYIKKYRLIPLEDFDRIVSSATPPDGPHTRTPASDQPEQVCDPEGVCAAHPPLAAGADILAAAVETVHDLGVTGEGRIIKGTFLAAVSQVLGEPVSLVVKGTSAGGKSYSTRTTLRLFPEADFYCVTAGSQRSLIYTDEEFSHRTIVMFEATALREIAEKREGDMTAMLVRTLMSEGRLVYEVTEKDEAGRMATRRITKEGPTNLIVTTTADNLHPENETRMLSLPVDESEEQTRRVMIKTAARRSQHAPADPPDLAPWHGLFHWLKYHGEHRVFIPYASYLARSATAAAVRMRRDFGTLLGMIEAHAITHQLTRERDEHGRIIATGADYEAARDILAEAFAVSSGKTVKDSVRRAVAAVDELGGEKADVTVAQVAKHMKRDRSRVTRGLKEGADLGYLVNMEDKAGRAARYRIGPDPLPEDAPALPATLPDDVCERTPAQPAHQSPQVSEGCAPVRGVRGGAGPAKENRLAWPAGSTAICAICGADENSIIHAVNCLGEDPAA